MPFVDEMKFSAQAGRGGDGVVRWRREKFVPKGGPSGGDGGRGGDFFVKAVRDLGILARYKAKKNFKASNGEEGGKNSLHGKAGEDFVLELPVGSVITNLDTEEKWELEEAGKTFLILRGGAGGRGNEHFKSSINTAPKEATKGKEGEYGNFFLELELFADLGLIGLPNAGKSSLLNTLTNAEAKVGDYPFTTIDPNLGDFYGFVIADIPGLIEGASEGKGLGFKFLRHIKRTKILVHLVSFENKNMVESYKEVRKELEMYDKDLALKKEIIILTKSDIVEDEKKILKTLKEFKKIREKVFILSIFDDKLIKDLKKEITLILEAK